jgi:hypothetical protein
MVTAHDARFARRPSDVCCMVAVVVQQGGGRRLATVLYASFRPPGSGCGITGQSIASGRLLERVSLKALAAYSIYYVSLRAMFPSVFLPGASSLGKAIMMHGLIYVEIKTAMCAI